ncbi:MAG: hypothetical protein ACXIVD_01850 [Salinarimonas sp.]
MADLSPDDIAWLRRMFAGRSPREIARLKSLLEAHCAPLQPASLQASSRDDASGQQAAPAPEYPVGAPLLTSAELTLLGVTDDLSELRALLLAFDMAFADLEDGDDRDALRTATDIIVTRLHTIRETLDQLHHALPNHPPTPAPEHAHA